MKFFTDRLSKSALSTALIFSTISISLLTTIKSPANVQNNISKIEVAFGGNEAQASWYDFAKDAAQGISNETLGRLFTQVWITSYDAETLEKEEGGAAWNKANDMCKRELRNRTGRAVSDISISVRKQGNVYDCFERRLK
jgi:hypothetical protein